jgi:hypothetical protein
MLALRRRPSMTTALVAVGSQDAREENQTVGRAAPSSPSFDGTISPAARIDASRSPVV